MSIKKIQKEFKSELFEVHDIKNSLNQTIEIPRMKTCKCGSTDHIRTSNKDCRLFVDKINKSKSTKRGIDTAGTDLIINSNSKIFKSAHKNETPSNHSVKKYY